MKELEKEQYKAFKEDVKILGIYFFYVNIQNKEHFSIVLKFSVWPSACSQNMFLTHYNFFEPICDQ